MDGDIETPGGIVIPASALTWRFSRGTGPGGQSVNTTDSRVELLVDLSAMAAPAGVRDRVLRALGGSVRVVAATERSQLRNRHDAVRRLVERVDAAAVPERPRRPTRPHQGAIRARLDSKRQQAERKAGRRGPSLDD